MGSSDADWRDWFQDQLEKWRREGLIDESTHSELRQRYSNSFGPSSDGSSNRLIYTIGLLGSILLGIGIILFIAANWQYLAPFTKTLILVGGVVLFYSSGYYLTFRREGFDATGSSLIFVGHLAYGSAIWLIAQTYHLGEHYPNGYLHWFVGVLAMSTVLALPSGAALSSLLLVAWVAMEHLLYLNPAPLFLLLAVCQFALTYRLRSRTALATSVLAVGIWTLPVFSDWPEDPGFIGQYGLVIATVTATTYWLAEAHRGASVRKSFGTIFQWFSLLGFIAVVLPYSFTLDNDITIAVAPEPLSSWAIAKLSLLGVVALASALVVFLTTDRYGLTGLEVVGTLLFWLIAWWGWSSHFGTTPFAIAVNLIGYVLSLGLVVKGYRAKDRTNLIWGLSAFSLLTLVRYFDMSWELMSRSAFFISGGIVLILVSFVFEYVRREMLDRMGVLS